MTRGLNERGAGYNLGKWTKDFSGEYYSPEIEEERLPHVNMRRINAIKYLHTMPGKWTKDYLISWPCKV